MSDSEKLIQAFRDELFRWNSQINLVSRQETEGRLEGLFNQCIGGAKAALSCVDLLHTKSPGVPTLLYFDLGSGGGLPGVIWHVLFSEDDCSVMSWLVEPREKRAWFLDRLNRIEGMPGFEVLPGRWGEVQAEEVDFSRPGWDTAVFLISLKALNLNDFEVLSGLMEAFVSFPQGFRVVIARYYPPGQLFDQELMETLDIPTSGSFREVSGVRLKSLGGSVVPLPAPGARLASLVLSLYEFSALR